MIGELWKKLLVTEYRCSKNFRKLWRRWDNGDRYSYFIRHLVYFFDLQHGYFSEYFVAGFENTCQWWILKLILNWFFNVLGDHRQISRPILTHFSPIFRFYTSWKRKKVSEKETEHWAEMCTNPLRPIVAFHIETNHLFCRANQLAGFYMKRNTGLKSVKQFQINLASENLLRSMSQVDLPKVQPQICLRKINLSLKIDTATYTLILLLTLNVPIPDKVKKLS